MLRHRNRIGKDYLAELNRCGSRHGQHKTHFDHLIIPLPHFQIILFMNSVHRLPIHLLPALAPTIYTTKKSRNHTRTPSGIGPTLQGHEIPPPAFPGLNLALVAMPVVRQQPPPNLSIHPIAPCVRRAGLPGKGVAALVGRRPWPRPAHNMPPLLQAHLRRAEKLLLVPRRQDGQAGQSPATDNHKPPNHIPPSRSPCA